VPERWSSFVALGDSFTEGLDDPRPDGGFAGWADRVAGVLAGLEPEFRYANLAIRGLGLGQVVETQVPAALAMQPDLISIAAGGNDVLRPRLDLDEVGRRFDDAVATLRGSGATVLAFAGFAPSPGLPFRAAIAARAEAYNGAVRAAADRHGAVLVDLWAMQELRDPRMWSVDRLHLSPRGHQHVCGAVLHALGVDPPFPWPDLSGRPAVPSRLAARRADLAWGYEYFLPWLGRRMRGRSSADGLTAKRPTLAAVRPTEPESLHGDRERA
jgi:lysophospholipase L1-like esterase